MRRLEELITRSKRFQPRKRTRSLTNSSLRLPQNITTLQRLVVGCSNQKMRCPTLKMLVRLIPILQCMKKMRMTTKLRARSRRLKTCFGCSGLRSNARLSLRTIAWTTELGSDWLRSGLKMKSLWMMPSSCQSPFKSLMNLTSWRLRSLFFLEIECSATSIKITRKPKSITKWLASSFQMMLNAGQNWGKFTKGSENSIKLQRLTRELVEKTPKLSIL